jgi:hypothetical protein
LAALGIKRLAKSERRCRLLGLECKNERFTFSLYRTEKNGFRQLSGGIQRNTPTPEKLGQAIRECLARCEMSV